MSTDIPRIRVARPPAPPEESSAATADHVLAQLMEWANDRGLVCVGHRDIGYQLNISSSTASRAMRRLIRLGAVEVVELGVGDGYPTIWMVAR